MERRLKLRVRVRVRVKPNQSRKAQEVTNWSCTFLVGVESLVSLMNSNICSNA